MFRASFEARLRTHFAQVSLSGSDEDPSWYALRNVVYASGCRTELGKSGDTSAFQESQAQGWRYFENALSMHTDLLYCRTGIMAVQALVAMVSIRQFFIQATIITDPGIIRHFSWRV